MNQLQKMFDYQGAQLRTVIIDGEPWFVVKDVCEVMGIANHRNAAARLKSSMKRAVHVMDAIGRSQETVVVNEPGVYKISFTSTKEEAEKFTDWLAEDVIPSIRKTGNYSLEDNKVVPLSKDQALVTVLRTTADLMEGQEEIRKEQTELKKLIVAVDKKVEEQITLTSGEQRKLQKEIAQRVYGLAEREEIQQLGFENGTISPDLTKIKAILFRQIHKAVKDCFAVPSYKDIRRTDLKEVLQFVAAWRPRLVA